MSSSSSPWLYRSKLLSAAEHARRGSLLMQLSERRGYCLKCSRHYASNFHGSQHTWSGLWVLQVQNHCLATRSLIVRCMVGRWPILRVAAALPEPRQRTLE